jgi:hypothetical protein
VPLIVHVPEKFKHLAPQAAGTVCADQVCLLDMGPTVLSWCGVPLPPGIHGHAIAGPQRGPAPTLGFTFRERMDERYDCSRAVYDGRFVYIRNFQPQVPNGQYLDYQWKAASMRAWSDAFVAGKLTPTQALFFKPKPVEELFDSQADPDNVVNLSSDPAYAADLQRLRAGLQAKRLAIRDTGFLPEPLMVNLRGALPPMTYAADDANYPLARLLPLVETMQVGRDVQAIETALHDRNLVVRYWAAMSAIGLPSEPVGLAALLSDGNAAIRVAACEAILLRRNDVGAVTELNAILKSKELWPIRLAAANTVSRLNDRAPFIEALKDSDKSNEYLGRIIPWLLEGK